MKARLNLIDLATVAASLAILTYAAWMLLSGPQGAIPMHYGADGTPDRFGDRMEAGLVIGAMGLMLAAIGWGSPITPAARTTFRDAAAFWPGSWSHF
ncbi:DUF1648 domain-containing protein [Brevundimonas denitrificans]|uniref:DUF1648 domain-containing protein n=1 Tax=Brevundimonas denitrificans TaxID=1443434 RepID=UPI00223B4CBF|nr:DUF1648 domain-containing protein [Brevundimonas denitrificans]